MPINGLKLSDITLDDIQNLIDTKERENQYLEYKEILPDFGKPAQKLEFLYDISAFANASGGDIIYGIKEKRDKQDLPTAIPVAMPGLADINIDSIKKRIEGIVSSGLQPPLRGLQFQPITAPNGNHLLIIRVPRSWVRPHTAPNNWDFRVYVRTASGKNPLSFKEIGDMIIGSSTIIERTREFRNKRLIALKSGELPLTPKPSAAVLHLVPAGAFEGGNRYTAETLIEKNYERHQTPLGPIFSGPGYIGNKYNLDGTLDVVGLTFDELYAYTQFFRNGIIESVNNQICQRQEPTLYINIMEIKREIRRAYKYYIDLQERLGISPPIFILISIVNVKGAIVVGNFDDSERQPVPIDRDDLLLPEIILDSFQLDANRVLHPAFESLWNATGLAFPQVKDNK